MSYRELPGFVDEQEAFGETTVTIETPRIRRAREKDLAILLRDTKHVAPAY